MSDRFELILQAIVTVALLVFAYLVIEDHPTVADLVIGATVAHWLNQSAKIQRGR